MVPHGFMRFNPTDEELIQVLDRKASGQQMPLHFILEMNVYERNESTALSNGERFYYCKREINDSREVHGLGWWKATSHVKKVYASDHRQPLVGNKRPLTFHRFKDSERKRNNAVKTNWIMHEYSLESRSTEWKLCKIKHKGKPSLQQHSSRNDFETGSSTNVGVEQLDQERSLVPADSAMPLDHYNQWSNMQQLPWPLSPPCHPDDLAGATEY
uniref:NAC domain-containing protein n=1 Tax=Salix viminalis TaxID=40686 RepID=A0A6N2MP55_SALVM